MRFAPAMRGPSTGLVFGSGFGAANSDRVVITDAASIQDFADFTMIGWYYNQASSGWSLMQKGVNTDGTRKQLIQSGAGGNLRLYVDRASTDADYTTSSTPLATVEKWYLVAATFNSSVSPSGRIYVGSLMEPAVDSTYSVSSSGSGATAADAGHNLVIGNTEANATAFHGRIAVAAYFNRALSLREIRDWQLHPQPLDSRVFIRLGLTGTSTQLDLSGYGNHGTITGAKMAQGVPFRQPRRDDFLAEIAAAATTGTRMTLTGVGF